LCAKCFDKKYYSCTHNDEERGLLGTWTTNELSKAVEKGYSIMEIYEVWHFKEKVTTSSRSTSKISRNLN
jgi:hypothetical protein